MTHHFTATETTYWIAHDRGEITSGTLEAGQGISTGRSCLETYTDYRQWLAQLDALHIKYDAAVQAWREVERLRDPLARLADYRWRKETGGVTLISGARVATTRESQSMVSASLMALSQGMLAEPVRWKAESGWVELTGEALRVMAAEVASHVNRCFHAEQRVSALLANEPTLDVEAAFDAEYGALQ